MAHHGKIQIMILVIAPPDQVAEGDRLFASHGAWMEATHYRTGEKALLSYNVSKAPELSDPLDLNSAPTGNAAPAPPPTPRTIRTESSPGILCAGSRGEWKHSLASWSVHIR